MRTIWEIEDIKAGTRITKLVGEGCFANYIIARRFDGPSGTVNGIFHVDNGEFITVGDGSKEAVVNHLNNCGFKLLVEE